MVKRRKGSAVNTSFYMTAADQDTLHYLMRFYELEQSALMRKLLTEAAAVIKYQESLKEDKK